VVLESPNKTQSFEAKQLGAVLKPDLAMGLEV